ncbi:MAG: tRNA (N(6)-L-threonylcarbamoyladenosine(37)-C(2))-methylthiotransferase MtaB [Albidovulum sp.]|nr:tRNA (N(6)-L-threonylcarbamoyladenosine(37)-C(2))-methylthiotransferase MtaB [Albidovulum sp.]
MNEANSRFFSLGCRLNAYETEAMRELSAEAGLEDAVIVNTCAVTAEAVRKSRQAIRRLARANPRATMIATGCAVQIDPDAYSSMAEVDAVVGNSRKLARKTWSEIAASRSDGENPGIRQVDDIMSASDSPVHSISGFGGRARAYVQVQNGCDHRCTFCIIPFGRGNSRSVPAAEVVEQVKSLVGGGFNEVVLTGVDLTGWGEDLDDGGRLGDLVAAVLASAPDLPRLRLSSIDPVEADPELLAVLASEKRMMPHLHLSLQSGDNLILKRMKRRHSREDAIAFCDEARRLRPEIAFGADFIAGFPTETESMFRNTLELIENCGLTWLHVFPFSRREGTPAARMPQVAGEAIRERAARLRSAGSKRVELLLDGQVGMQRRALMETSRIGRAENFAEIEFGTDQEPGRLVDAVISSRRDSRLLAHDEHRFEPKTAASKSYNPRQALVNRA